MASLLRAQLRLVGVVILTVGVLVGLPVFFWLFPRLSGTVVLGMPLAWVLLGAAVHPLLWFLGWVYVRSAERNERDFADVVERS